MHHECTMSGGCVRQDVYSPSLPPSLPLSLPLSLSPSLPSSLYLSLSPPPPPFLSLPPPPCTQDYTVSQTTLDDVFIHFASQQSEDILDHTHRPHPPAADLESGVANSDVDRLPDIVPPGNGSRKLTSSTGGIIKYTKLQDSVEVDTDHDHEQ